MTTTSSLVKPFLSLLANCVIASSLDPGITIPETSKVFCKLLNTSAAHPFAWLFHLMAISFYYYYYYYYYFFLSVLTILILSIKS
jgi:hypothetical protein